VKPNSEVTTLLQNDFRGERLDAPVIFVHYGNSYYLQYTIQAVKLTNPNKRIILLGDVENVGLTKYGIEHFDFEAYDKRLGLRMFDDVFQLIAGNEFEYNKSRGTDYWAKFVFKRWFYINEFVKDQGLKKFWTFDSDNLILENLNEIEDDLAEYDCTTQCADSCLNGLVNNIDIVERYVGKIIALFRNHDFLEYQKGEMVGHSKYAYTEMRAFQEFRKSTRMKVRHLQQLDRSYMFDDCLAVVPEAFEEVVYGGTKVKALYFGSGTFYIKASTGVFIKTINVNLSWLDEFFYRRILFLLKSRYSKSLRLFVPEYWSFFKYKSVVNFRKTVVYRFLYKLYFEFR
jgi:hypothetical protein